MSKKICFVLALLLCFQILSFQMNMVRPVYAAPPAFTGMPEVSEMFLPPTPPPDPMPVWIPEPLPLPGQRPVHVPAPMPVPPQPPQPLVVPAPELTPGPDPVLEPAPVPVPEPELTPGLTPDPAPEPAPDTYPPTQEPTPEPIPAPAPEPAPTPDPGPATLTGPQDIAGHWAEGAILYAFNRGLINMPPDNIISPNQRITRGEFAFSLDRWFTANLGQLHALGFTYEGAALPVVGVPANHPFRGSIESLAAMGMIGGEVDFMPDEYVQRQEVSRIWLNLFLRLPNSSFNTAYFSGLNVDEVLGEYRDGTRIASWARDAVAVMTDREFMGGSGGNFRPTDTLTRAEAYVIFQNIERGLR